MDVTSILRNEIFRPTVTLVIPGGIAVSPYLAIVFHYFTNLKKLATDHFSLFGIVLLLILIGGGLLVDDIGSWLESILDSRLKQKEGYKDHMINWKKYWRLTFKDEPIGHRYLRTILLSLKFELNLSVSLVLLWFGLWWLYGICYITGLQLLVVTLIIALITSYLMHEGWSSAKLLSNIRKELLKGVGEPPMVG